VVWGYLPVPIGLALYLKEKQAEELARPYQTRSALARAMLERVVSCLPDNEVCSVQDGAYATKAFLRERPEHVQVVSRLPIDAKLYALPALPPPGKRGPKPKKGNVIGSAKSLVRYGGWQPHPHEAVAEILVKAGIWHSVLPGVVVRVVFVRRTEVGSGSSQQPHKRPLEAFFSTNVQFKQILAHYQSRWTIEIAICASVAFYGLAQDGCRKFERIVAINSLRLLFAAAQLLWFIAQSKQRGRCNLELTHFGGHLNA
jgi:hypothetical protein